MRISSHAVGVGRSPTLGSGGVATHAANVSSFSRDCVEHSNEETMEHGCMVASVIAVENVETMADTSYAEMDVRIF